MKAKTTFIFLSVIMFLFNSCGKDENAVQQVIPFTSEQRVSALPGKWQSDPQRGSIGSPETTVVTLKKVTSLPYIDAYPECLKSNFPNKFLRYMKRLGINFKSLNLNAQAHMEITNNLEYMSFVTIKLFHGPMKFKCSKASQTGTIYLEEDGSFSDEFGRDLGIKFSSYNELELNFDLAI